MEEKRQEELLDNEDVSREERQTIEENVIGADEYNENDIMYAEEQETDELLYEYRFSQDRQEAILYADCTMKPSFSVKDFVIAGILCALGIYMLVRGGVGVMLFLVGFAALYVGTPFVIYLIKRSRFLKRNRRLWDREVFVRLFEAHGELFYSAQDGNETEEEPFVFSYDEISRVRISESRLYWVIDPIHVVIASKSNVSSDVYNGMKTILE